MEDRDIDINLENLLDNNTVKENQQALLGQKSYLANWEMLQQAFFHPLVNAIKFNQNWGSISVKISYKVKDFMPFLELSIKNTGYGIPSDEID